MGFREDLERLLDRRRPPSAARCCSRRRSRRTSRALAKRYQRHALRIATAAPQAIATATSSTARSRSSPRERDLAVVNLLRYHDAPGALVFCATRDGVTHLAANLTERGFAAVALSGELSQRERNQALQALRDGRARVCVATDVAARGLDLPDLGLVIHADLPQNAQMLVHRSGRTGRAGKHGIAILLVPERARAATSSGCVAHGARRGVVAAAAVGRTTSAAAISEQLVAEIGALAEPRRPTTTGASRARCSPQRPRRGPRRARSCACDARRARAGGADADRRAAGARTRVAHGSHAARHRRHADARLHLVHDQRRAHEERRSEVAHPAARAVAATSRSARSARSRSSRATPASRSRTTRPRASRRRCDARRQGSQRAHRALRRRAVTES